ncbi:MAG: hypothetical protein IKP28_04665 [Clostridia bacterium]|nr:hypothetical protein [Clostridia bacterium]
MNSKYTKAYKEVVEIIKYFPQEEYNKIPKEKIEFYETNMDKDYQFAIDPSIDLSKQNISKETNAIIVSLYQDYFATEEQKEKINEILELNEMKEEQEKREKYSPDELFKNNEEAKDIEKNNKQETALVEYKENFFTKFKNFIFKLLHIS